MAKKTKKRPYVSAVIVASGISRRMEGTDKLMLELDGVPVFLHTLSAFQNCESINEIILVCHPDNLVNFANIASANGIEKLSQVVKGGETRTQSVYNGLLAVNGDAGYVAVHDGARPLILPGEIDAVCAAAFDRSCAIAAIPMSDTVKVFRGTAVVETIDRERLCRAACPQVADKSLLLAAVQKVLDGNTPVTDESMALELLGASPEIVFCSPQNIKITVPEDVPIAQAIIESRL